MLICSFSKSESTKNHSVYLSAPAVWIDPRSQDRTLRGYQSGADLVGSEDSMIEMYRRANEVAFQQFGGGW
jgi:hypothetical protein